MIRFPSPLVALFLSAALAAVAHAQAPANDSFAAAQTLAGDAGTVAGTNVGATGEAGEPTHYNASGTGSSVWYRWTPSVGGNALVSTVGSPFDTVLAVYTGSSLGTLVKVAEDDESGGANTSLVSFNAAAGTTYRIAVGSRGTTRSAITLNYAIATPPAITTQPADVTASLGGNAQFQVGATGGGLTYRWFRNGTLLPGATGATLALTGLTVADGGTYEVTVANSSGTVRSAPAVLRGSAAAPVLSTPPAALTATAGQPATLSVAATGTAPLSYQWRRAGFPLPGATAATYTIPSASRADADLYDVIVSSGLSATVAPRVRLSVAPAAYPGYVGFDSGSALFVEDATSAYIESIFPLADGRYFVAGNFATVDGLRRPYLVRFRADHSPDPTFTPPALNGRVLSLAVQSDGRLLVAGYFSALTPSGSYGFARLLADGAVDPTFTPGTNSNVNAFVVQPDGRILLAGSFTTLFGQNRSRLARLLADGTLDTSFVPAEIDNAVERLVVQPDGRLLIAGFFNTVGGQTRPYLARLSASGALDAAYAPAPNSSVRALAVLPDGRSLVGGFFSQIGGQNRSTLARLAADGSLDSTYNPAPNGSVTAILPQADGSLLLGGNFSTIGGQPRSRLARLAADGSVAANTLPAADNTVLALAPAADGTFLAGGYFATFGAQPRERLARFSADGTLSSAPAATVRAAGTIRALLPAPGDRLYVAGRFTHLNGTATAPHLVRLTATGNVDSSFTPPAPNSEVRTLALQSDGALLVGGSFTALGSTFTNSLVRLSPAGTLDPTFNPQVGNGSVEAIALQSDGSVLVGGYFTVVSGLTRPRVARLGTDGRLDSGFAPTLAHNGGSTPAATAFALQPDGKIVLGGTFTSVNGTSRDYVARLHADGTLDPSFAPALSGYELRALHLEPDGKILLGGGFYTVNGQSRSNLTRLNPDGTLDSPYAAAGTSGSVQTFLPQEDGRLLLGGYFGNFASAPATASVARATAAGAPDLTFRFAQGLAAFSYVGALHLTDSGHLWIGGIESGGFSLARLVPTTAPAITSPPVHQTAAVGATVTFSVVATGTGPLAYQWLFNGATLPGATAATLTLASVQPAQAGSYAVVVSNSLGAVTSAAATLSGSTPAPVIATPLPATVAATAGQAVTLTVGATGTPPLSYQWRRNGYALPGATGASFTLPAASRTDADVYDVIVASGLSATVATPTRLTVAPTAQPGVVALDPAKPALFENTSAQFFRLWPLADGRAFVAGQFVNVNGIPRRGLVRLLADGTVDPTFAALPLANYWERINDLLVLSDGRLIVGGSFYLSGTSSRNALVRLLADGTVDSTYANRGLSGEVTALALAPEGRVVVGGSFFGFFDTTNSYVSRAGGPVRLNADGSLDATFNPSISGQIRAVAVQADGKVVLGGDFSTVAGQSRSYLARLHADGTYDASHATGAGPSSRVTSLLLQPDGKLLVGGWFSSFNGANAGRLVRLEASGAVDSTFVTGTGFSSDVNALALDASGRVTIAGYFGSYNNASRTGLARLSATGTLDAAYANTANVYPSAFALAPDGTALAAANVNNESTLVRLTAAGARDTAYAPAFRSYGYPRISLALPGGKLLVGGDFTHLNGTRLPARHLVRFNADGTYDSTFALGTGPNGGVGALLLEPDGRILVGGWFDTFNGLAKRCLVRLAADGTLDPAYPVSVPGSSVYALARSPGGQTVIGGFFTTVGGIGRARVARLHADGALDLTFDPGTGPSDSVQSLAVTPDRQVYLSGYFSTVAGQARPYLARLKADGTLDPAFANPGLNSFAPALVVQPDGKLLVGSYSFNNVPSLLRLLPDGTRDPDFSPPTITSVAALVLQEDGRILAAGYENGTATPYLFRYLASGARDTTFAATGLGDSIRSIVVRDDGQLFLVGDYGLGGQSTNPAANFGPSLIFQPQAQTVAVGGTATFAVTAYGSPAPAYLWRRNGIEVPGGTGATLVLTDVQTAQAGSYYVTVTNAFGSVASNSASLTVNSAGSALVTLTSPAAGATLSLGTPVTLTATATNPAAAVGSVLFRTSAGEFLHQDSASPYTHSWRPTAPGTYTLTATAQFVGGTSATSAGVTVTVPTPATPVIVHAPVSTHLFAGATAVFRAVAYGTGSLTYQWSKNSAPLAGATTSTLTLGTLTAADAASYTVTVSNANGTVTSPAATLAVHPGPAPAATYAPVGAASGSSSGLFATQALGARFTVGAATRLTAVTAQFSNSNGSYYAALVPLASLTALPIGTPAEGIPFNAGEVVAVATFTVPDNFSGDFTVVFDRDLAPGTYAVVIGTGLYGTSGSGGLPRFAAVTGSTGFFWSDQPFRWAAAASDNPRIGLLLGTGAAAAPAIVTPPQSQTVAAGGTATFSVVATGSPAPAYQWSKGTATLPGATAATLVLANVQSGDAGTYTVTATNSAGSATSSAATLTVTAPAPARGLLNLAQRTTVDFRPLHGYFTVEATAPKLMLVRGAGPALAAFGISGALADPRLVVVNLATGSTVATNDDWSAAANAAQISGTAGAVGAFAFPANSKDAAIAAEFSPGTYRVDLHAPAGSAGVALLEIYDADTRPRLVHLASRGHAGTGTDAFIVGFSAVGSFDRKFLIRALGPTLGLPGSLADPRLVVFNSAGQQVVANDDWAGDATLVALAATAGAMPLAPASKDAAIDLAFNGTAAFTVQASGANNTTGEVLVEIFETDPARSAAFAPLVIVPPAAATTVAPGANVTLAVVVHAKPAATFQWRKGGTAVPGATAATISLSSVTAADAATYDVVATNASGSATSAPATVTVSGGTAAPVATHALVGTGYLPGGTVTITNTLTYSGTASSLGWSVTLPAGWSFASSAGTTGDVQPAVGETGTIGWAWSTVPPSPVTFTYTLNVPAGETTDRTLAATAIVRPLSAAPINVSATPLVVPRASFHDADTDRDLAVNLSELTRVIALYNVRNANVRTGAYLVATTATEDGFAPDASRAAGASATVARHHSADSNRDARFSLVELTRVIELYNTRAGTVRTGRYRLLPGSEDGFAPGP